MLLTLGSVIGSGIFIVPATVLTLTGGDLGPALFVWVAGGLLSLLGALTYAELAAMKPETGGLYVFIRDAFGSSIAFLYGWALFLVIASATVATLAVAFSYYLRELVPLSPLDDESGRSCRDRRHRRDQRARHTTQREPAERDHRASR